MQVPKGLALEDAVGKQSDVRDICRERAQLDRCQRPRARKDSAEQAEDLVDDARVVKDNRLAQRRRRNPRTALRKFVPASPTLLSLDLPCADLLLEVEGEADLREGVDRLGGQSLHERGVLIGSNP